MRDRSFTALILAVAAGFLATVVAVVASLEGEVAAEVASVHTLTPIAGELCFHSSDGEGRELVTAVHSLRGGGQERGATHDTVVRVTDTAGEEVLTLKAALPLAPAGETQKHVVSHPVEEWDPTWECSPAA